MDYSWDFSYIGSHLDVLWVSLYVTTKLTLFTVVFGYLFAIIFASLKTSSNWFFRLTSGICIEVFRDVPVLVLLIWLYYCLPAVINLQIEAFWIAVIGLGLNFAALEAVILKSGFDSIPRGEIDAAYALGFSKFEALRFIVLPQALWRTLAPTLGQMVNTLKLTSLASFIAVGELFHVTGMLIQETYRPLEFYSFLAVLYLIIIAPLSIGLQLLEKFLGERFRRG